MTTSHKHARYCGFVGIKCLFESRRNLCNLDIITLYIYILYTCRYCNIIHSNYNAIKNQIYKCIKKKLLLENNLQINS